MRRRKLLLLLSIMVMLLAGYLLHHFAVYQDRMFLKGVTTSEDFAGVVVPKDENKGLATDIRGYVSGNGIYLFLPCRADASHVTYYSVDEDGNYLQRFENDFTKTPGVILDYAVVVMQSALPTMEITLDEKYGTLKDVEASEDHTLKTYGDMVLEVRDDVAKQSGWDTIYKSKDSKRGTPDSISFRGRGNITWLEDKKPYAIELESEQSLLGMASGKKWVLLANAADYSLLRDEVFYQLSADCNMIFNPEIEQIDLFINGEYRGTYSLCTKVEISPTRVNIRRDHDFLFRWGMPGDGVRIPLESYSFRDKETKTVELIDCKDKSVSENGFTIAKRLFAEIEDTQSDDYLKDMDLTSWAKYYWIQEFAKNTDATARSVYTCWIADEQKMYMGPVWDMDRTAGVIEPFQRDYDYLYPTEWAIRNEEWFVPLFQHPEFVAEVNRVYYEEGVRDAFTRAVERLPGRVEHIRASAQMNFIRWNVLTVEQNNKITQLMGDTSYDAQTGWLTEWLRQRAEWIEDQMKLN